MHDTLHIVAAVEAFTEQPSQLTEVEQHSAYQFHSFIMNEPCVVLGVWLCRAWQVAVSCLAYGCSVLGKCVCSATRHEFLAQLRCDLHLSHALFSP